MVDLVSSSVGLESSSKALNGSRGVGPVETETVGATVGANVGAGIVGAATECATGGTVGGGAAVFVAFFPVVGGALVAVVGVGVVFFTTTTGSLSCLSSRIEFDSFFFKAASISDSDCVGPFLVGPRKIPSGNL